jgi:hypothetical protein
MGRTLFPVAAAVTVRVVLPGIPPEVAVMVAVPSATAVARPPLLTVATDVMDELQVVTCVVISWLAPSEYVPKAANCRVFPTNSLGLAGAKDMEDRVAAVTVRSVLPEIVPKVAMTLQVPTARPVARPVLLLIDATDVSDKLQMTCMVISRLAPSEYVPVAVNCLVMPTAMLGLTGVTAIETSVGVDDPPPPPLPPLPPHPATSTQIRIRNAILLDFIDAHSWRD